MYRSGEPIPSDTSESVRSNWTQSHIDIVADNFWQDDNPLQLDLVNHLNNLDLGMANPDGAAAREPPPPYAGPGQNAEFGAGELLGIVQGLITAQQNAHRNQVEADARFQNAHRELGVQIENLTQAIGAGGARHHHGGAQAFKPSMFRALDMKATNKENKLLSEEFIN